MKFALSLMAMCTGLLLAGCASLTPSECATANWHDLGFDDGAHGRTDRSAEHHQACSKVQVVVDVNAYRSARNQGLQQYCRLDNAINIGLSGHYYAGVCPGPRDAEFRQYQGAGAAVHSARNALARLKQEQQKMEEELRDAKSGDERKRELRAQLAQLDRKLELARDELSHSQNHLERLQAGLRTSGRY